MQVFCVNEVGWGEMWNSCISADGPQYGDFCKVRWVDFIDGKIFFYLKGWEARFLASEFIPIEDEPLEEAVDRMKSPIPIILGFALFVLLLTI